MNPHYLLILASISTTAVVGYEGLAARADVPLYGQCGGVRSTTCAQGVCTYGNAYYSQCIPGSASPTPSPTPTTTPPSSTANPNPSGKLPSSFRWSSSGVLISPEIDSRNVVGIKDPSVVYYNGVYHVFTSIVSEASGYNLAYLNFTDFSQAASANQYYLDQSGIGTGYRAAPEIFYFSPQRLWYLIFQNGNSAYSTNPDISNPHGWSAPTNFFSAVPSTILNLGNGGWLDMWVICDFTNCHLFSSDDNGHLYRSQTSLANFPNGMSEPVVAMQDSNPYYLYEASNVYNFGTGYLLLVEAIGSDGHRFFRSWTSSSLTGPWTALADSESNPFARASNVVFSGTPWSDDISHGEMIRSSYDQTLTISPCNLRYLYQGDTPGNYSDYNATPWRLALLTQTNSAC
ncbi:glycosyl hydrolase family 62 protein [Pholiota conissans]|uniref:Alpha-L-arabinofuranosidase n=1 Tax=Pholiota conissans TaxID=109636 RepID=A0A9P5YTR0_9AGAR|nr:glycosyl hydrolase family 62 protein [Pholiota conissans]